MNSAKNVAPRPWLAYTVCAGMAKTEILVQSFVAQECVMKSTTIVLVILVLGVICVDRVRGDPPVIVGVTKQLFFDDYVIEKMEGLKRTVHPAEKHAANPVLIPDQRWENTVHHPAAVIYNDEKKRYEMWYHSARIPLTILDIAYAHSTDGIHWVKPQFDHRPSMWRVNNMDEISETGKVRNYYASLPPNNLVLVHQELQGVVYRPYAPNPDERYISSIFGGTLISSPDGIHWTRGNTYYPGQNNTFNYDPARGLFFGYFIYPPYGVRAYDGTTRRVLGFTCSHDLVHWTGSSPDDVKVALPLSPAEINGSYRGAPVRGKPVSTVEVVIVPDEKDDELATQWLRQNKDAYGLTEPIKARAHYNGMCVFPYESVYIGFPVKLSAIADHPKYKDELIRPSGIELAFSRDLRQWTKFPTWVVPYGPTGQWDHNQLLPANKPIIVGNEVWLYYGGHSYDLQGEMWGFYGLSTEPHPKGDWVAYHDMYDKKMMWNADYRDPPEAAKRIQAVAEGKAQPQSGIGIAKWRLDGFVSLDADELGGTLVTKSLIFSGTQLRINADASGGSIGVEIQDGSGKPIEGYTLEDCHPLTTDAVHHIVTWRGKDDLGQLAGYDLKLRFILKNATLYAFQFVGAGHRTLAEGDR